MASDSTWWRDRNWSNLSHAYGSAEDVPRLLAAAAASPTPFGEAWDEIWSRLCHQGTIYSASFEAIPELADMAKRVGLGGYVPSLHLVAAIIASTDGPPERLDARDRYSAELAGLRDMAEQGLALAADDTEFVYGLEALMAFEDGGVWQRKLNHVADGELPFDCPDCGEYLLLDLEGPEFLIKNFSDASGEQTSVTASEPTAESVEGRLLSLTRSHGRATLVEPLRTVFGEATCPSCLAEFAVPAALT